MTQSSNLCKNGDNFNIGKTNTSEFDTRDFNASGEDAYSDRLEFGNTPDDIHIHYYSGDKCYDRVYSLPNLRYTRLGHSLTRRSISLSALVL